MSKMPSASISKITFFGETSFNLAPDDKIVLVGPNNAGKSQVLRDIQTICRTGRVEDAIVVKDLELEKDGSEEDLQHFLNEYADYRDRHYYYRDWVIHESYLAFWSDSYLKENITEGFIRQISANERLSICEQQKSVSPDERKTKPQHILYDDEALMAKISGLFRAAFGKDIMFDFRGGSKLPIHVGEVPEGVGLENRVGDRYVEAVRVHPLLDKQGDGMKSYAGILFDAVVANRNITLIDEPEAFLHPPQMRKLGETLASEVSGQLLVATHSSDILRGFLEGAKGNVRILRIHRDGDYNIVYEASTDTIRELWQKPDIRYSNALDGIFHEQTIICEDDSDCRLINAVADHLATQDKSPWQDTVYVPTGGKHGAPKIANVLRNIGVPVKTVFDIDFLSEKTLVKEMVEAQGGDWKRIQKKWSRLDAGVRGGVKVKSDLEIKEEIIHLLQKDRDELPRKEIAMLMKASKAWENIKKFGERAIPNGEAQTIYSDLKRELEGLGIFLVPVGEVENFCQSVGNHGPRFVTKLLAEFSLDDSCLKELRQFVAVVHKGDHGALPQNSV